MIDKILAPSEPIETNLRSQQLTIDDLESRFLRDLGSTNRLESIQRDVMSHQFPPLESQISGLEKTLTELGDKYPDQSTQPLKQQEAELRKRLKRLESSVKQSIGSGQEDQKAASNLLTRGDLIKRRLDELGAQLDVMDSGNTVLDPETLKSRLEDVNNLADQVSGSSETTLKF